MTGQGDFAAHRRDGDDVIKVLDGRHPAGARFVAAVQNVGMTGMYTYLSTLRAAGVTLSPRLSVESVRPLAVRHRWVTGPVLLDCASADPSRFHRRGDRDRPVGTRPGRNGCPRGYQPGQLLPR